MNKKVIKQHVLPVFEVKRFFNSENYFLYDIKNKTFKNYKLRSKNDVLQIDKFYEFSSYKFNEIEDKLSKMENYTARIFDKIINCYKESKDQIKLTWSENYMIRIYFHVKSIRSKAAIDHMSELSGDSLFNSYYADKNAIEIKEEQLVLIEKLYSLFSILKNKNWEKYKKTIIKYHENLPSRLSNINPVNDFYNTAIDFILYMETRIFFLEGDDNGTLSEHGATQTFFDNTPFSSFEYIFIHPKILIYFKRKKEFSFNQKNEKNVFSIFESIIPKEYEIKKFNKKGEDITRMKINNASDEIEYCSVDNFYVHKIFKIKTNNLMFKFELLNTEAEVISLLNALSMIHSKNFHLFINENDLKKTLKIIESKLVNRIEDRT